MGPVSLEWYEVVVRLVVAAVLGGALGIERAATGHEAGLRTHVLVAIGSGLFATLSVGAFDELIGLRSTTNVNVDVTRIAAYVAPGIGFIGAGVIVKTVRGPGSPMVVGLTTAASLWTAAAIGVAAGLGFWSGAVAASVIALVVLAVVRPLSAALEARHQPPVAVTISAELRAGMDPADFVERVVQRSRGAGVSDVRVDHGDRHGEHHGDDAAHVVLELEVAADEDLGRLAADLDRDRGLHSVRVRRPTRSLGQ
ncbi:MAG: MgtC/SapB family protein [Ilumatobacteraceae bacterium]